MLIQGCNNNNQGQKIIKNNENQNSKDTNNIDKIISDLQKMLEETRARKTQIQEDKELDEKIKRLELQSINEEIQNIQQQIAEAETEKQEQKAQKNEDKENDNNASDFDLQKGDVLKDGVIISQGLSDAIKFGMSKEKMHVLKNVKNTAEYEKLDLKIDPKHPFKEDFVHKRIEQVNKAIATSQGLLTEELKKNAKIKTNKDEGIEEGKEDKISQDFDGKSAKKIRETVEAARKEIQ